MDTGGNSTAAPDWEVTDPHEGIGFWRFALWILCIIPFWRGRYGSGDGWSFPQIAAAAGWVGVGVLTFALARVAIRPVA